MSAVTLDSGGRAQIRFLVLQPTNFCNIDCTYCYLPSRHDRHLMSLDTLTTCVEKVFSSNYLGEQLEVIWHAGEPLSVPLEFYVSALQIIEKLRPSSLRLRHALQTNGLSLNADWARFLVKNRFDVGLSLDGPAAFHDRNRITRARRGTFSRVMEGLATARANGLDPSVIAVLSLESLKSPDQLFDFFNENQLRRIGFSIIEQDGVSSNPIASDPEYQESYRRFMARFWNLSRQSRECWTIREFDVIGRSLVWPSDKPIPNNQVVPLGFLGIDWQGNCSTFSPEFIGLQHPRLDLSLGSLVSSELDELLSGPAFKALYQEIRAGVELCAATCEYFLICGGGAPANKLGERGRLDVSETAFCILTKQYITDLMLAATAS